MNGISVMTFVQAPRSNAFGNEFGALCRTDTVQDKCITITPKKQTAKGGVARENRRNRKTGGDYCQNSAAEKAGSAPHRAGVSFSPGKSTAPGRRTADKASAGMLRFLVLALVFSGMLAGFCMMTRASNPEKEQTWKYYTTVTLAYGEDLTDIIYRYCDRAEYASAEEYLREVCSINSLPYRRGNVPALSAGTQIVVPYYSSEYK